MPFDQIQCADLKGWRGGRTHAGWSQICKSVEVLVGSPRAVQSTRTGPDRRKILVGGAAVGAAALAGLGVWRMRPAEEDVSPQAQLLMQKGFDALQENDALDPEGPGSTMQAIALMTQATQAAPRSASAWGGLALAYAVRKRTMPIAERPGLEMRSRAAAKTALGLNPREGRALGALLLLNPVYKHWLTSEQADRRAVQKNSSIPLLLSITSDVLANVGRWTDALSFSKRMDRTHFLIPGADRRFIMDLWGSGNLQAADATLQASVDRWPGNPEIWRTRLVYLMYTGRAGEAAKMLGTDAERPSEIPQDFVDAIGATTEALAGARPAGSAVAQALSYLRENPASALYVANACSALGALDDAFAILEGYYFNLGEWAGVAPLAGDQDRITSPLFLPPMRSAWKDARFSRVLRTIGLEEYWRETGTVPDFRNTTAGG